ncbi:MAG: hypothetical protein ACTSUP_03300 [Candidatus Heimdallarchaeaceae archaeon]
MAFEHLYLARFLTKSYANKRDAFVEMAKEGRILSLESFWDKSSVLKILEACPEVKIFLDSGAFTLGSKNVENIQGYLDDYIAFALKYKDRFSAVANLDDVYNVDESWKRQKYMEEKGVRPIPVYHFNEDFKWLEKYVNEYDYIGIGGVAAKVVSVKDLRLLLDKVFDYMSKKNLLSVKVHGFGVAAVPFLLRYPWYSCDATSWFQPSNYGKVFIPKYDKNKESYDYAKSPWAVKVSELGMYQSAELGDVHYTLEYPEGSDTRNRIEEYFKIVKVDIEKLKTSNYEREKVNVHYFENLAKILLYHKPSFHVRKSFFI